MVTHMVIDCASIRDFMVGAALTGSVYCKVGWKNNAFQYSRLYILYFCLSNTCIFIHVNVCDNSYFL